MIIFLFGQDDWRREEKKKKIVSEFLSKNSTFGLFKISFLEEEAPKQLREFMSQESMFESKKLAVITDFFEGDYPELLEEYGENKDLSILISSGENPKKEFSYLLTKPVISENFPNLEGASWEKFVKTEAEKRGLKFEKEASEFLARAYEGDSWRFITELEKISFLEKSPISLKDLAEFDIEIDPDYWSVIQRTKGRALAERLTGLESLIAQGEPLQKTFYVLSSMWNEKLPRFAEQDFEFKSGRLDFEEALLSITLG